MADNDLNNDQSVTDQGLQADPANQQDLNTADSVDQQSQETLADGDNKAEKTVKYSEFEKANNRAKAAEEQTAHAQRTMELMQQNAVAPSQTTPMTAGQQALKDLNLTEDELYGPNVVAYTDRKDQILAAQNQQSNALNATRQFAMAHPDINEVVGSVNPSTGQITQVSSELLAILNTKPYLREACTTLENAYQIVMDNRPTKAEPTPEEIQAEAQRKVDLATAPLGGSAAGGSGGGGTHQGQGLLSREQVRQTELDIAAGKYR